MSVPTHLLHLSVQLTSAQHVYRKLHAAWFTGMSMHPYHNVMPHVYCMSIHPYHNVMPHVSTVGHFGRMRTGDLRRDGVGLFLDHE